MMNPLREMLFTMTYVYPLVDIREVSTDILTPRHLECKISVIPFNRRLLLVILPLDMFHDTLVITSLMNKYMSMVE